MVSSLNFTVSLVNHTACIVTGMAIGYFTSGFFCSIP